MFDKLASEEQRYEDLMRRLGTAEVQNDPSEYRKHAKALADVQPLVERFREYKAIVRDLTQTEELAASGEEQSASTEEIASSANQLAEAADRLTGAVKSFRLLADEVQQAAD